MNNENPFSALAENLKPMNSPKFLGETTGVPEGTWAYWRAMGIGPKFSKVGRSVLYAKEDILQYFDQHRVSSTSEAKAAR